MKRKNIPLIHNYCDRWCERCTFISRCAVGEVESNLSPEEKDMSNKAFWDNLSKNFAEGIQLLKKAAKKHGFDLDSIPPEAYAEKEKKRKENKEKSKNHPLGRSSLDYSKAAMNWIKTRDLKEKQNELIEQFTLGLQSEATQEASAIKDSVEIINWYSLFIHVKLIRALMGKESDEGWEEENGFQRDFDGSAKVALIAVDRSVQAWSTLFRLMPEREDEFFPLLAQLQKIKTMAEKEFPKAQQFIRPGFDEAG